MVRVRLLPERSQARRIRSRPTGQPRLRSRRARRLSRRVRRAEAYRPCPSFSRRRSGADAATSVTGAPGFGSFEPSVGGESYGRSGGNGSIGAMQPAGLTAQRHENSVLFSLANLEALAKPSPAPLSMPRSSASPISSTSATTEGSGLIDIRAMANMTLGGAAAKEAKGDDLPAFSAPQFSPVAPVLLPMGSSGTPRWAIVLFSVLGAAILGLGVVVVKMFTTSPAPPPVVAVAPPAPVAGSSAGCADPAAGHAPARGQRDAPSARPCLRQAAGCRRGRPGRTSDRPGQSRPRTEARHRCLSEPGGLDSRPPGLCGRGSGSATGRGATQAQRRHRGAARGGLRQPAAGCSRSPGGGGGCAPRSGPARRRHRSTAMRS